MGNQESKPTRERLAQAQVRFAQGFVQIQDALAELPQTDRTVCEVVSDSVVDCIAKLRVVELGQR